MSSVIEFLVEKIFFFTVFMKLLVSIWKEEEEEEEEKKKKRKKEGYLMEHAPSFASGSHMCAKEK
jgi:hypothetical protein